MMSTIEGVGGEVIQFFICLGVLFVCLLLWWSTRVRTADEPFFRTVYVLERRVGRNTVDEEPNPRPSIMERPSETIPESSTSEAVSSQPIVTIEQSTSGESVTGSESSDTTHLIQNNPGNSNAQCDGRLYPSLPASGSQNSTSSSVFNVESKDPQKSEETVTSQSKSNIKVRLKYTNDDSREVDGLLHERLLDFKRRNFPEEISANKLIRLIFNGRLLRDDDVSLQNYGLFDDCVVHCLVVNERPQQPSNADHQEHSQQFSRNNDQTTTPEWNLSKMLCFIVVGILSVTWYCRFQFAALFTFTSTSFLFGLTVIFLCSMFGTFYVDSVPFNNAG